MVAPSDAASPSASSWTPIRRPGHVGQGIQHAADGLVADVGDERRGLARGRAAPADPVREGGHDGRLVHEDVRMVPFRGDEDHDVRAVRVEVAGVLVRLDDEVAAGADPGHAALRAGDRGRQQRPDEAGRVHAGTHEDAEEPARRRGLAMRPGDPDQPTTAGRGGIGDHLLHALGLDAERAGGDELGVVGIDRRDRLGDRDTVHDGRAVGAADMRLVVLPGDRDPGGGDRAGQGVRTARVARGHDRSCGGRVDGRAGRRGATDADHVDPGPGLDRSSRSRRRQAATDLLGGPRHRLATSAGRSARSRSTVSAAAALSTMFPLRSRVHWYRRTSAPSSSATAT